jgi:hypothetical protein
MGETCSFEESRQRESFSSIIRRYNPEKSIEIESTSAWPGEKGNHPKNQSGEVKKAHPSLLAPLHTVGPSLDTSSKRFHLCSGNPKSFQKEKKEEIINQSFLRM